MTSRTARSHEQPGRVEMTRSATTRPVTRDAAVAGRADDAVVVVVVDDAVREDQTRVLLRGATLSVAATG